MTTTLFTWVGQALFELFEEAGRFTFLVRSSIQWILRGKIEARQTLTQVVRIGIDSLPVTTLTSFFTGMVLALEMGATSSHFFNEPLFIGTVVSFAIVMELGPVMTAIVVAGRAGAAIAAELGTMRVTEQVDALYTLGTDPVRYLVIPRVLAFLVVLPILTVAADFSGILGGYFVASAKLHVPPNIFWHDIIDNMVPKNFWHGYIKTYVFATALSFICCYKGITTRGGAEGVGKSTTAAVVLSMVSVLVLDYFATAVLNALGIT